MPRNVKLLDANQKIIGELMGASDTEILQCIAKGMTVVDTKTQEVITESDVTSSMGISDGEMIME